MFWKHCSKNPVLGSDVEQCLKKHETLRKHQLNMFWGFLRIFESLVLGSKIRFSAQMSNNAKIHWNAQKTPTNNVLRLFKKFWKSDSWLKTRFSAQMSNYAKIPWNTQKPPAKHVLRLFEKFLKIRFSVEKSGSRLRFRTMLKYLETPRKHQLNMFWGFLRNFWKSCSRLKHPVLGSDVEQC